MRSSTRKKIVETKADVAGPCPFCHRSGGTISVDFDSPQPDDGATGFVFHSLPACETYLRLSADEFVRAVIERKHLD